MYARTYVPVVATTAKERPHDKLGSKEVGIRGRKKNKASKK